MRLTRRGIFGLFGGAVAAKVAPALPVAAEPSAVAAFTEPLPVLSGPAMAETIGRHIRTMTWEEMIDFYERPPLDGAL